jgi:hypothetical protein
MPRRRASPKVEGKIGSSKFAQAASAAGNYDGGNDFPVDDLPPDDLPVRDIAEDQDEQHPAHSMAIRAADQAGRDLADPVHAPNADSPEPVNLRSGGGHPTLSAALLHEPVVETSARDPQPKADAAEPQTHYLFPELVSDDPLKARLRRRGRKHGIPSRRPRGSSSTSALNAAQIELWPDENNAVGDTYPG